MQFIVTSSMRKTIIYSLTFITVGLGLGSLGPTLPALASKVHVDTSKISYLFAVRSLGTILGSLFIGKQYDRIKGHPILVIALITIAVGFLLVPYASSLSILILLFLILGISYGTITVGGNSLIARVHGDQVGPYITALHLSAGIGGLIAPIIVSFFASHPDHLLYSYTVLSIMGAIPIVLLFISSSPPLINTDKSSNNHNVPDASNIRFSFGIGLLLVFFCLQIGAESTVMNWLYSFALGYGMSIEAAALINSAFWAAFSVSRLVAIWCFARFNIITITIITLITCIVITPLIPVLPFKQPALWFGAIGLGLAIGPIFPGVLAHTQRILGLSGKLTGWIVVSTAAGGMFWPWLVGQFFDKHGANVVIWVLLPLFTTGLALFVLITKSAIGKGESQKELYEVTVNN